MTTKVTKRDVQATAVVVAAIAQFVGANDMAFAASREAKIMLFILNKIFPELSSAEIATMATDVIEASASLISSARPKTTDSM